MKLIEKIQKYNDWRLLFVTFMTSLKISFFCFLGKEHLFFWSLQQGDRRSPRRDKEKIIRYVNLCTYLRRKFGIIDACFTHSLLLCSMLRWEGFDAKVHFGAKRKEKADPSLDSHLVGHCWVTTDGEDEAMSYHYLFQYPQTEVN